jgi:histidine triad (HIT) family protein
MPSLFTRIITGEIPAQFVFQEAQWVAFLDIKPTAPGHALLVPRLEVQHLGDLPAELQAGFGVHLARLIAAVKRASGAPAANVLINDGPAANQAIPHVHAHVIPRFPGDGRVVHPPGAPYADAAEAAAWGNRLRAAWAAGA